MKNLTLFSLFIGVVGIILLGMNFILLCYHSETFLGKIARFFNKILDNLPFLVGTILGYSIGFTFIMFLILSPVGICLGVKSLKYPERKIAIFSIILNSINFLFALFIAWLLFGLARGM